MLISFSIFLTKYCSVSLIWFNSPGVVVSHIYISCLLVLFGIIFNLVLLYH